MSELAPATMAYGAIPCTMSVRARVVNPFTIVTISLIPACAFAQSWNTQSNSAVTFVDLVGSGRHAPPANESYYDLYLPFPVTSAGTSPTAQVAYPACPSPAGFQYQFFSLFADDTTSPNPTRTWVPAGTPLVTNEEQFFVTDTKSYIQGIEYDGALGGSITGNTDPNTSQPSAAIVEAVFAHQRHCYDGGPEFGFYRVMTSPTQYANQVYFYYSDATNCIGPVEALNTLPPARAVYQTNCGNATGQFTYNLVPPSYQLISWPPQIYQANKCAGLRYDWLYQARVTSPTAFTIDVLDPCTLDKMLSQPLTVTVEPWFQPYTQQMYSGGLWAYTSLVLQKALDYANPYGPFPKPTGPPPEILSTLNRGDIQCTNSSMLVGSCADLPAVGIVSFGAYQSGSMGALPDVEPQMASGYSQIFTVSYYDSQAITAAQLLINNYLDGSGACYVTYVPGVTGTNAFNLANNNNSGYTTLTINESSGSASNSQCTLYSNGSSVTTNGSQLILTINISFSQSAFAGHKVMWAGAQDGSGHNTYWQPVGTYSVTPATALALAANSLTYAETGSWTVDGSVASCGGSCSAPIAIQATFLDSKGSADITNVEILINHNIDGANACYVTYGYGLVYLYNDAGNSATSISLATIPAGGSSALSNSQCVVTVLEPPAGESYADQNPSDYQHPTSKPISGSGNTLTFQLNIQPTGSLIGGGSTGSPGNFFEGALTVYTGAQTAEGANTGWNAMASWIVP